MPRPSGRPPDITAIPPLARELLALKEIMAALAVPGARVLTEASCDLVRSLDPGAPRGRVNY